MAEQSFSALLLPPIVVGIAIGSIGAIASFVAQNSGGRKNWKTEYWLIFVHYPVFFCLILTTGILGWRELPNGAMNQTAWQTLSGLEWLSWLSCVYWIWRCSGARWMAGFIMFLQQALLGGASLMATMAVSGAWL